MKSAKPVELYSSYQEGLARWSDTDHTRDLFFDVMDAIGISLLEPEKLERALERLHDQAYRPARLHTGQLRR